MPEERPVGSLELMACLADDAFGTVHLGQEWSAPSTVRPVLVRQYHAAWLDQGLAARRQEILRNLVLLGNLKPYQGCHASQDGALRLVWPYAPGRSLADVLEAARTRALPFGIDQALFLVWALSHHLRHLHRVGLSAGMLAPHRIWIGFDGWVQLLDVPAMNLLQEILPSLPEAQEKFAPYLQGPPAGSLASEAFQLGAVLFEALAHKPLPVGEPFGQAILEARVTHPEGSVEPIPEPIARLLERLLGGSYPFRTLEDLERTMEDTLFGGDYDPSTFGLAFTMQTLFREELQASVPALDDPAPEPAGKPSLPDPAPQVPGRRPWALVAATTLILGGGAVWLGSRSVSGASMRPPVPVSALSVPAPSPAPMPRPLPPRPTVSEAVQMPAGPPSTPAPAPAVPVQVPPRPAPREQHPVKLRVFVDEQGCVRQAHVISGTEAGSEREQAAVDAAMHKHFPAGQASRNWEEITVLVP